jgi:hypothetical protein
MHCGAPKKAWAFGAKLGLQFRRLANGLNRPNRPSAHRFHALWLPIGPWSQQIETIIKIFHPV